MHGCMHTELMRGVHAPGALASSALVADVDPGSMHAQGREGCALPSAKHRSIMLPLVRTSAPAGFSTGRHATPL